MEDLGKFVKKLRPSDEIAVEILCAVLQRSTAATGRLRRKPEAEQFLRLTKDENQCAVDKTS